MLWVAENHDHLEPRSFSHLLLRTFENRKDKPLGNTSWREASCTEPVSPHLHECMQGKAPCDVKREED